MKSVLISIKPEWVEKICHEIGKDENGKSIYEKRIEVRKTAPKEVPFKCYIYCTKGDDLWLNLGASISLKSEAPWAVRVNKKVIGEFICDKVMFLTPLGLRGFEMREEILKSICLTNDDLNSYGGLKTLCGWHISDLKIYDKPKELSEFCIPCKVSCENCKNPLYFECWCEEKGKKIVTRPPRSWMYVEEVEQ